MFNKALKFIGIIVSAVMIAFAGYTIRNRTLDTSRANSQTIPVTTEAPEQAKSIESFKSNNVSTDFSLPEELELKKLAVTNELSVFGLAKFSKGLIVGGNNVINSIGKIPAINGNYFVDLNGENITNVDAHHLGGKAASSFLRSDEPDTAEAVINFTASPGSTDVNGGSLYINPSASDANYTLFGAAVNGSSKLRLSAAGNLSIAGGLALNGDLTSIRGITYSFPSSQGGANSVLSNDGSGTLTWGTLGAAAVTADSLDFAQFADTMTLDASTDVQITGSNVFSLTNTGSGNSFVVNDSSSDTSPFVIDASGSVGIGGTSPSYKLDVTGTGRFTSTLLAPIQDNGGQVFNVKAYGATGDGSTDDHDAIVSALTAAGVSGGTVYFPTGTYLVNSQITWPDKSNITIAGAGRGATTIKINFGGSPSTGIGIYINSSSSLSGVTIRDMLIQGAANDDTAPYDLVQIVNNVSDVLVDNVEFKWARHSGLRLSTGSPGNRETVTNSYFHDINSSAMTGIGGAAILSALSTFKVENTTFENTGNASTFHAIYLSLATDRVSIVNNSFSGTHTRIQFYGGPITNASVTGNTFNGTTNIFWDTSGLSVTGNTFYNAGVNLGSDNVILSGNTFYATSATTQIQSGAGANYAHIEGNKFVSTTSSPNTVSAISHNSAGDKWIMTNNTFNGGYMKVMTMYLGDGHIFSRNQVVTTYDNETVHISGATNVVVNDNRMTGAFGSSVRMESGSGTAQGNTLLGSMTISGMVNKNYITDDGSSNVGIGTTSPTGRLHSYLGSTATTSTVYGGYFENLATNTTTDAINKYGLYITSTGSFTGSSGTATNNYGLYINTPTGGDNNFSLYSAGGDNYFAGNIGINTTPSYALDILNSSSTGMVTAERLLSSNASTKGTQLVIGTSGNEYSLFGQNHSGNGTFTNGTYLDTFIANTNVTGNYGNIVLATHGSDRVTVTYDGNLGVGASTTSGYKTYINGSFAVNNATTDKTGNTSWGTISDARLKDIQGNYKAGLDQIMQLNPVVFNYKIGNPLNADSTQSYVGFVAQDVQNIIPEAVSLRTDGYLRLTADPILWAMVNAIKEQQGEIVDQSADFSEIKLNLNNKIADLDKNGEIASIEKEIQDQNNVLAKHETRINLLEDFFSLFKYNNNTKILIGNVAAEWMKDFIFHNKVTFEGVVSFVSDVNFFGRNSFEDRDLAGYANIKSGSDYVNVIYEKPYKIIPVVSVSPRRSNVEYFLQDESVNGFTIKIINPANQDIVFSWISLQIKDPKTFESGGFVENKPSPTPSANIIIDTNINTATESGVVISSSDSAILN